MIRMTENNREVKGLLNREEIENIKAQAERGTCSHAYIVDGEQGVGKSEFAKECARILLCTGEKKPCGICDSCKKTEQSMHPDVFTVGSEKTATMDDVREIIRRSSLMPTESDKQIFIVENAGKLRRDAQNALLKIIEEPPETVTIFLLTDMRSSLLPTVLSRGQKIHLSGMTDEEIMSRLVLSHPKEDKNTLKKAVSDCHGNLGLAEKLLSKEFALIEAEAQKIFDAAASNDRYMLAKTVLVSKQKRDFVLSVLYELLEKLDTELKSKYIKGRNQSASSLTRRALFRMSEAVTSCIAAVDSNANLTASLTKLVSNLFAAKA